MAALGVYLILKPVAETIIALPKVREESIDTSLLRIGARVLGFLIGTRASCTSECRHLVAYFRTEGTS